MERNVAEAKKALSQKPLLSTSVERVMILNELQTKFKELAQPLRFSRILSELLSRVSLPLEEYDLIAGRCVDENSQLGKKHCFSRLLRLMTISGTTFWSSGHCTYSWEMLVKEGLVGLRQKAAHQLAKTDDDDKKVFLSAMIEVYDAITAYILRYAEAARQKGMLETANNLFAAAAKRPDSFASALQLLWIVTLINCAYISENPTLTVGRLDQILYPLYQADIENGRLSVAKAKDYITDYYCKHNLIMGRGEHQVGDQTNSTTFKRITNFDAPQYLLLGGKDANGNVAINELTELFVECIDPSFKNPVAVVRYTKGMEKEAPSLWNTVCRRALESASLMIYNDDNVTAAFRRIGLPAEDAGRYAHFGCNWCSPGDNGAWMTSWPQSRHYAAGAGVERTLNNRGNSEHGWPEDFMIVMRELAEKEASDVSIDDFYERFFARMGDYIDRKLAYLSKELSARQRRPASAITFGDCFLEGSVNNAECFSASAKYHFEIQTFMMFGTVADCFIAVDQLVMIEKKITLRQLLRATEANFEGFADVLAMCRTADKYGMDTPLSNKHARRLSHTASALVIEKSKPYFEKQRLFLIPCMQSDTWHLKYGRDFGATPDGRLAFTPFSQNTRPSNGACKNGLTAMFNDMLLLPRDGLVSGALNLDISAKQFSDDKGEAVFSALLATYFSQGGLHVQVTATDVNTLLEAQRHPHLHRDLRVRVTGYSGVFVDICKSLQDDIIERFK